MGCSNSHVNDHKIDLLQKEKNFLKSDLEKIHKLEIREEDFLEFQEKIEIPKGEMFRYKCNKRAADTGTIDDYSEDIFIYISADLGQKITKKNALKTLQNEFIRKKSVEISNLKSNSTSSNIH